MVTMANRRTGIRVTRRSLGGVTTALIALGLAGCMATPPPPPPPPTIVNVTVAATADVNPNAAGRPSPVRVTLFELTSPSGFQQADFFQLDEQAQATLGGELVSSESVIVPPGGSESLTFTFQPPSRALGVIASFQNIDAASWRATVPIAPNQTTSVTVTVSGLSVTAGGAGL